MKTIKDNSLSPYYIECDSYQYLLKKNGEHNAVGYFSKLESLLDRVVTLKAKKGSETVTLKEFLSEYRWISASLKQTLEEVMQ